jgi:hypothetical protein
VEFKDRIETYFEFVRKLSGNGLNLKTIFSSLLVTELDYWESFWTCVYELQGH